MKLASAGIVLASAATLAADIPSIETRVVWRASVEHGGKSSPRLAELNGDGHADVVAGSGFEGRWGEVVALDGKNGQMLWRRRVADEVLAAEPLLDVDGDGTTDVLVIGRKLLRDVLALSGRNGKTLWQLSQANPAARLLPVNVSSITLLDDRDGDGLRDLLATQSGGEDEWRPAGRLYEIRSRDGKLLSSRATPDGRECYAIPLHAAQEDGRAHLYLGTGGETLSGDLFRLAWPAASVDWRIRALGGGFIGSPVLVDLDADGVDELLATTMHGAVYRIEAATGRVEWRWRERPWWSYVTPAAGEFDGKPPLDVVAAFNRGLWPRRDASKLVWLEGASGRVLAERAYDERWRWTASSPLVLDLDLDGRDETLIVLSNPVPDPSAPAETHRLVLFGGTDARDELFALEGPGYSIATPLLADLDGNGKLDLVHTSHYEVVRIEVETKLLPRVRCGELRCPGS